MPPFDSNSARGRGSCTGLQVAAADELCGTVRSLVSTHGHRRAAARPVDCYLCRSVTACTLPAALQLQRCQLLDDDHGTRNRSNASGAMRRHAKVRWPPYGRLAQQPAPAATCARLLAHMTASPPRRPPRRSLRFRCTGAAAGLGGTHRPVGSDGPGAALPVSAGCALQAQSVMLNILDIQQISILLQISISLKSQSRAVSAAASCRQLVDPSQSHRSSVHASGAEGAAQAVARQAARLRRRHARGTRSRAEL